MPSVSNSTAAPNRVEARRAQGSEISAGVAILLAGEPDRASLEQVQNFIDLSGPRGIDLDDLWIGLSSEHVCWAMLPVLSPGGTMLLLSPPRLAAGVPREAIGAVIDAACLAHAASGVQLAQLLIDPAELSLRQAYVESGFLDLAELIYLSRDLKKFVPMPSLSPGIRLLNYRPDLHPAFADTIAQTYHDSLDCPGLSGLRTIEDVIVGHKGTNFDPATWYLLTIEHRPSGVLLMGSSSYSNAMELVYLGLVPEARGRGLGDVMMQLALWTVHRHNRSELTLAVDARNAPAIKLYFRHGLKRMGSRAALIRKLSR